jgi:hypothetical protein
MFGIIFFIYLAFKAQDQKGAVGNKSKLKNQLFRELRNWKQIKVKIIYISIDNKIYERYYIFYPSDTTQFATKFKIATEDEINIYHWCNFDKQTCSDINAFSNIN